MKFPLKTSQLSNGTFFPQKWGMLLSWQAIHIRQSKGQKSLTTCSPRACESCQTWYFVPKIVLTYCEKKLLCWLRKNFYKFDAEGRELPNFLRSIKQFINIRQSKGQKSATTCSPHAWENCQIKFASSQPSSFQKIK